MSASVNRIIANHANAIVGAALVASAQRASSDLRLVSQVRSGGGSLVLSGPYGGADDSRVEAEIVDGAGASLRASAPTIRGVGNGLMTVKAIDAGAVSETLTFSLLSAGTVSAAAELSFYGVVLRALTPGPAGNALTLEVARNLTFAATEYATLATISAGTVDLKGGQWNFGAASAIDANIPADAPRLSFEGSPGVYRHWRSWVGGDWVYHLDPPPNGDIAADSRVLAVSGDYTLTLSDGLSTEVYQAVTTYDFLATVRSRSTLIEVVGAIAYDRAPGGQGITDIPLRTDAHALAVVADVQSTDRPKTLANVSVSPGAQTENIVVRCKGGEAWSVSGSLSGSLPEARTLQPYSGGPVSFTIPGATAPQAVEGTISAKVDFVSREADESLPSVCIDPLKLGALATSKTVTFTYALRPLTDCDCSTMTPPNISDYCLGLAGLEDSMDLPAEVANRIAALYLWRESFIRANTGWTEGSPAQTVVDGGSPGGPGQYRVHLNASIPVHFGTQPVQYYPAAGYLVQIHATAEQAQAVAQEIAALITTSVPGNTVSGYLIAWTAHPGDFAYSMIDPYSFFTNVETMVEAIPAVPGTPREIPATTAHWNGADKEIAALDRVTQILAPCIYDVYADTAAAAAWDGLFEEFKNQFAGLFATVLDDMDTVNPTWYRRWEAACDNIRIQAGIFPKSEAGTVGGTPCWRDDTSAGAWWVEDSGVYLPAFTGQGYVTCKKVDGQPVSTQEFGFGIVVACEGSLKPGDKLTVTVQGNSAGAFGAGDQYTIPVVAGGPAQFGGGAIGDPTQVWTVQGDVTGPTPDWRLDPTAPADYADGPITVSLAQGGIPWAVGDTISVGLEGGRVRYRRDGGTWAEGDVYAGPFDLGDGLSLAAVPGRAPSFVAGDSWAWDVLAAAGTARLRAPRVGQAWSWDGDTAVLDVDFGAVQPIGAVSIALHTLPAGATIRIDGGDDAADTWTLEPAWCAGPILAVPSDPLTTARYLRLTLANCGSGAGIGWLWAGMPWAPTVGVSSLTHIRQYGLTRSGGLNPTALYRGRGTGGRWSWNLDAGGALLPEDLAGLLALLDHVAEQGLEWVCLVPDIEHPASATLAQIDADEVTLTEHLGYMLDGQAVASVELPFRAVLL